MESFTFFWSGVFSQWHQSPFTLEGKRYSHAEQFMMEQKALLFGDAATAAEIMTARTPREQKALGRKVRGFDAKVWDPAARGIVFRGNWAKYTQNAELKSALLATSGTTLVEASPKDAIWGIGLAEDDPRARDRRQWLGKNWLGQVLTQVREAIIRNDPNPRFMAET